MNLKEEISNILFQSYAPPDLDRLQPETRDEIKKNCEEVVDDVRDTIVSIFEKRIDELWSNESKDFDNLANAGKANFYYKVKEMLK